MSTLKMAHAGPTAQSVAAARQAQADERAEVQRLTGVQITDDEPFDAYTILCPRCLAPSTGDNRGQADRAFARHYVAAHVERVAS